MQHADSAIPHHVKATLQHASGRFLATLRDVLIRSMAQGIPHAASLCADTAQTLTRSLAQEQRVELRRISLQARNPLNRPNSREQQHLQTLERMQQVGTLTDSTVIWDIVERDGIRYAHMIRPIILNNPLCLNCHGTHKDIAPETAAVLSKRYPQDKARGYTLGQVRGAVSVLSPITP
ncbi:MAG: DUF3365 domain-containing protein [Bacteroidota bacterium]|nr:DUF3365 domain-containing protein [Candidatus Kapabacteria bacterium]MDW8219833.1 DUF3365 domain-containing protein [Bacteroidota bacterium]